MNPLLCGPSEPLAYHLITAEHVREATTQIMTRVRGIKTQIQTSENEVQGRLLQRDHLWDTLDYVLAPVYLLKETASNKELREACQASVETLYNFYNELFLDEDLFQSLKTFADSKPDLSPLHHRYLSKNMDSYLRNGFLLSQEDRASLKDMDDEISGLELDYQKNVAGSNDFLILSDAELDGLPIDYKKSHRTEDGTYRITTRTPDYQPIMQYALSEDVRKRMYKLYLNRAKDQNLEILFKILKLRVKRATFLGFTTFADYKLKSVMAEKPEKVWAFFNDLSGKLKEKATNDYRILCEHMGQDRIEAWNRSFATNRLKEDRFSLDEEEMRNYFPMARVCQGLFDLAKALYQVDIRQESFSVWHEDVNSFGVYDGEQLIGRFYFDMFPRANKYSHAACFGLQAGRQLADSYQIPTAALICNFPLPVGDKPSLLTHDNVETFFHEFGHLMHQLLTTSPIGEFSGTSVHRDFVEMPSQIMERWAWEKESLIRFACHYESGEPIPDHLIKKLVAAKNVNSGLDNQQQLFYAALDMTYHDGFDPRSTADLLAKVDEVQERYTLFKMVPDTCLPANFEHLIGYASGYYGYLWSRVFADDMYSVFQKKGLYSPEAGKQFRDLILAQGNSRPPMELIESFLGRKPQLDAFLDNLGISAAGE